MDGKAIAVIDIEDTRERDYAEHLDFMRSVGQLLAGAFEKALLLERLEDGNRELRQLVDAGLEFGASLEMDDVLRSVATRMRARPSAAAATSTPSRASVEVGLASIEADDSADLVFAGTVYRIADMNITRLAMEPPAAGRGRRHGRPTSAPASSSAPSGGASVFAPAS